MSEYSSNKESLPSISQFDFERISAIVNEKFQVEEYLLENGIPTFYLKQPQETKKTFLALLKSLERINYIAILRKADKRIVLKAIPKQPIKKSNILVNWILFFATIATTFFTGYLLSQGLVEKGALPNQWIGGAAFSVAIMVVLGMHEMGHKLTADREGIDATPPYFIPGPPPIFGFLGIGTFGAVIMQKSLPPNKDALFDIGANGPILGFILAAIMSAIGLLLSPVLPITDPNMGFLPSPLIFELFLAFMIRPPQNHYILLHPIAFAGWVGMLVTMLNLLPAAMLDGGHVSRSLFGEKMRTVLTVLSFAMLILADFWPMAIFLLFISMYKHPGPLDDVSGLSRGRKLFAVGLIAVFVLCSFMHYYVLFLLEVLQRFMF
ncbi:MAG: site-2 protease family protein [Candidatus Bathyarchaeia archaeon]